MDYEKILAGTHDLRLGEWGPYGKRYMGLSHIADHTRGLRFDLCAAPGLYRRRKFIPNVRWECGYHPWECSPDLEFFTHRHELEWKDRVYCDISFMPAPGGARLMRCHCVNNTPQPQNLVLHLFPSLQLPNIVPAKAELPSGAVWQDALSYRTLAFARPRPQDSLCYDGLRRAEIRRSGFTCGRGLGCGFGKDSGDHVIYEFACAQIPSPAALLLRFQIDAGQTCRLRLCGPVERELTLTGSGEFQTVLLPCAAPKAGINRLEIVSLGGAEFRLDGFCLGEESALANATFAPADTCTVANFTPGPLPQSLLISYPQLTHGYALWWSEESCELRQHFMAELENTIYDMTHNHVSDRFSGPGNGHYLDVFMRPLFIAPESSRTLYALVLAGEKETLAERLAQLPRQAQELEDIYLAARATAAGFSPNPAGEKYAPGQRLMAATTLSNCVFPAWCKGGHIRHHTPGRWWDSLYTWDSGFIGLGLNEVSRARAVDNLNAYLSDPGDTECAFIHHGSPVPVQFYLFKEIHCRHAEPEFLRFFYPRLRQYYAFLAGRTGSSDTLRKGSGLLSTWSYFYNSGGWDDYPPQAYFHQNRATIAQVAPACATAHLIRCARILSTAAGLLGLARDVQEYTRDIADFGAALQRHSWDEKVGYFGYVPHDRDDNPQGILRHASGQNFNMGLDGASPLIAGICTPSQRSRVLEHLQSPQRLWSPCGISTVDQSAAYYREDGYWNGAVWMPHQWFFWKSALDYGLGDFAWQIAQTALELWKNETDESYNCFEHFIIGSRRGAGWHHFGGLSTPVLCWFNSYCVPGNITGGHDCWVLAREFSADLCAFSGEVLLEGEPGANAALVLTLKPGRYQLKSREEHPARKLREIIPGAYEISLPAAAGRLKIEVMQAD